MHNQLITAPADATKRCGSCRHELPFSAFAYHDRDGLQTDCNSCRAGYSSRWRSQNRERHAAYQRRYRAEHPERAAAWRAAARCEPLTRHGRCAWCGSPGPVERHHPDYQRPTEVEILCKGCHVRADFLREAREAEQRRKTEGGTR